ncbi:hypothetical protein AWC15_10930 [Mycobacterium lacus]|nr:hypothetical protein AWC15_10930 [Mycobacterium lacus]
MISMQHDADDLQDETVKWRWLPYALQRVGQEAKPLCDGAVEIRRSALAIYATHGLAARVAVL